MSRTPPDYGACELCGGSVVEKRLTVDRRVHGRLFEFEGVPVGVCQECGQRVFKGSVLERLEQLAGDDASVKRTIRVPVARYEPVPSPD